MCGIIGISSNKPVSSSIINSLKKLEYRGYDSAGIATLFEGEVIVTAEIIKKGKTIATMRGEAFSKDGKLAATLIHTALIMKSE